jgi:cation:H+ antiporter
MVDRWEGIAMFIAFVSFNIYLFWLEKKGVVKESKEVEEEIEQVKNFPWWKATLFFFGGIVGLYFGSDLLVENAVLISRNFGVSERVIGVTIIAIGTSLPELITSIMAALAKETDMALGNILGSNIMNILSIIGITAIIEPISVADEFIRVDFWWMIGITVLLFPLIKTKMQISKFEGSILFLTYLAYMFFLL